MARTQIKKTARRFDSLQQEAYLSLWRTYDRLRAIEDDLFLQFDLTAQQYNLLRLLHADRPRAVSVSRLFDRLISRGPDVTRMLDRLETRGLVSRTRSMEDRRAVFVTVTRAGLDLLRRVVAPLARCHERQLGHLTEPQLKAVVELLAACRAPHEPEGSPWK